MRNDPTLPTVAWCACEGAFHLIPVGSLDYLEATVITPENACAYYMNSTANFLPHAATKVREMIPLLASAKDWPGIASGLN